MRISNLLQAHQSAAAKRGIQLEFTRRRTSSVGTRPLRREPWRDTVRQYEVPIMRNWRWCILMLAAAAVAGCANAPVATPPSSRSSADPVIGPIDRRQQECMALAMYWEARGEGRRGMEAVGWTILNRAGSPYFPSTPCEVVFEGGERPGCQFSWYCDGRSDRPRDWHSWQHAMRVAGALLTGRGTDPTGGALFFHSSMIDKPWRRHRVRTTQIGGHVFYR